MRGWLPERNRGMIDRKADCAEHVPVEPTLLAGCVAAAGAAAGALRAADETTSLRARLRRVSPGFVTQPCYENMPAPVIVIDYAAKLYDELRKRYQIDGREPL